MVLNVGHKTKASHFSNAKLNTYLDIFFHYHIFFSIIHCCSLEITTNSFCKPKVAAAEKETKILEKFQR